MSLMADINYVIDVLDDRGLYVHDVFNDLYVREMLDVIDELETSLRCRLFQ